MTSPSKKRARLEDKNEHAGSTQLHAESDTSDTAGQVMPAPDTALSSPAEEALMPVYFQLKPSNAFNSVGIINGTLCLVGSRSVPATFKFTPLSPSESHMGTIFVSDNKQSGWLSVDSATNHLVSHEDSPTQFALQLEREMLIISVNEHEVCHKSSTLQLGSVAKSTHGDCTYALDARWIVQITGEVSHFPFASGTQLRPKRSLAQTPSEPMVINPVVSKPLREKRSPYPKDPDDVHWELQEPVPESSSTSSSSHCRNFARAVNSSSNIDIVPGDYVITKFNPEHPENPDPAPDFWVARVHSLWHHDQHDQKLCTLYFFEYPFPRDLDDPSLSLQPGELLENNDKSDDAAIGIIHKKVRIDPHPHFDADGFPDTIWVTKQVRYIDRVRSFSPASEKFLQSPL